MRDEYKLGIRIATLIAIFLVSAVGGCTAVSIHRDGAMLESIRSGADPVKVRCAFRAPADNAICALP